MERLIFTLLFVFSVFLPICAQKPIKNLKPTVILISLDGFRYDYLDKFHPKTLNELAKKGVRAKWLIPSFPTKTFPNHYTIATGLYPEHHGIVENNIFDFDVIFTLDKRPEVQNPRWWLGEPIWATAEKQNQIAASYFFPGTETDLKDLRPTFFKDYNGKAPNDLRVDKILSWLDLPIEKRPTMLTLYFSDVDDAGHEFAPDAEETRYAVLEVDDNIKRLVDGLKTRKIFEQVNLIIVSDHGMATVDRTNSVFLDDIFDFDKTERILWTGEIVQIFPKANEETNIIKALQSQIKHATCWLKSEIPERFHYRASPRIAPIVCSAEEGWVLTNRKRFGEWRERDELKGLRGAHGYDNGLESMRATFIAHGAAFKRGALVEPFENIHIYNLMCKILGLTPAKNDGDFEKVKEMMK
ncbi:MAG: ectonucleotide pyrophosphatase/phosphodiesterase [Acidobacteriota bacterium]|nr:ectonucleotide pyrophosphatase/phosphodiesterase [Acidobacteriota bacterium]